MHVHRQSATILPKRVGRGKWRRIDYLENTLPQIRARDGARCNTISDVNTYATVNGDASSNGVGSDSCATNANKAAASIRYYCKPNQEIVVYVRFSTPTVLYILSQELQRRKRFHPYNRVSSDQFLPCDNHQCLWRSSLWRCRGVYTM